MVIIIHHLSSVQIDDCVEGVSKYSNMMMNDLENINAQLVPPPQDDQLNQLAMQNNENGELHEAIDVRHLPDIDVRHLPDIDVRHLPDIDVRHLPDLVPSWNNDDSLLDIRRRSLFQKKWLVAFFEVILFLVLFFGVLVGSAVIIFNYIAVNNALYIFLFFIGSTVVLACIIMAVPWIN